MGEYFHNPSSETCHLSDLVSLSDMADSSDKFISSDTNTSWAIDEHSWVVPLSVLIRHLQEWTSKDT